jgi:hypothetical protein
VAFRFKKASCVAAGTFNIYIIQPHWLTAVGILPAQAELMLETNLNQPGFRLSSPRLRTVWIVTPSRLVIETESESENCGEMMAAVLQRLSWTPVGGIGNNVAYEALVSEVSNTAVAGACGVVAAPEGYEVQRRGLQISAGREGRIANLQMEIKDQTVTLTGNVHTGLQDEIDTRRAQASAGTFFTDRLEVQQLLERIFQIRIEHVASNA